MATDTMTDDELQQQEEQRRKLAAAPIGKPIVPARNGGVMAPGATIGADTTGSTIGTVQPPAIPSNPPPIPSISGVTQPIAPRPAGQRLETLAGQGPPQYHGLKRVLDTIAGATKIGSAIEQAGGIGTQGYEARLGRAGGAAGEEESQIEAGEKERQANATAEETGARAGQAEATAGAEKARGEAATAASQNVMITLGDGRTLAIPQRDLERYLATTQTNQTRTSIEGMKETAAQALQGGKRTLDEVAALAVENHDDATLKKIQDFKTAISKAGKSEPGNFVPVNDASGNIVGWADPKSRDWVPAAAIGGGAATKAAGGEGATAIPAKPGQLEERMAKMADYTTGLINDAETMVKDAQNQLGPVGGRWNDFVTGKVGLKNVDYASIKAQMTFVASAMTLAHSQGRVSTKIFDEFSNLYNNMDQDPANVLAALDIGKRAMGQVRSVMGAGGNNPAAGGAGAGAVTPPPGAKVRTWNPSTQKAE